MKLDTFMVAEAASAADGKLFIHGGGLTQVTPPVLPWVHPQLALVARVEVSEGEEAIDHTLTMHFTGPDGEEALPPAEVLLPASDMPERREGRAIYALAVLTLAGVPLDQVGTYRFSIDIDGTEAGWERIHVYEPGETP